MPRAGRGLPVRRGRGVCELPPPARGNLRHMRGAQGATCLAGQVADMGLRPRTGNSGKRRNEVNKETIAQIGGLVAKESVTYSRKVSTGDYGSEGAVFGIEADTPAGSDVDAVGDALYAWAKAVATRNLAPDLKAKTEPNTEAVAAAMNIVRGIVGDDAGHERAGGPPAA